MSSQKPRPKRNYNSTAQHAHIFKGQLTLCLARSRSCGSQSRFADQRWRFRLSVRCINSLVWNPLSSQFSNLAILVQVPCRRVLECARAVRERDRRKGISTEDPVVSKLAKTNPSHSVTWPMQSFLCLLWFVRLQYDVFEIAGFQHPTPGRSNLQCFSEAWTFLGRESD